MFDVSQMNATEVAKMIRMRRESILILSNPEKPRDHALIRSLEREIAALQDAAMRRCTHAVIFEDGMTFHEQNVIDWARASYGMEVG